MIEDFSSKIPEQAVEDLKRRLKQTRWPDEILHSEWEYGANLSYVKEIIDYWLNKFDWRLTENEINQYPNFIAEIDGVKIHFIHIKSPKAASIPLIITHGWPGCFLEFMHLIPLLIDSKIPFDLIIPSIPGFGFSQGVNKPGCDVWFIANLWHQLIRLLGYEKVIAQGGDFGAGISTALALMHPEVVSGLHLNYIPGSYSPFLAPSDSLTNEELDHLRSVEKWYEKEGAYAHVHRTKPITLAYGLNDSPVGLCAWILEKFYGWSDCNGNIESIFSKDELLSNISLYWFTETIHSSIRLYNEARKTPMHFSEKDFVHCPVGIARFHKEEPFPPRRFIERGFNVQHWTEFQSGGHFAAMEQPRLLAGDIIEFSKQVVKLH